jgi:PEP-CTERM motif
MRKNKAILTLASLAVVAGFGTASRADVIYSDTFAGAAGTVLGGNTPAVASGLDGGTAGATWNAATTTGGGTDAVWNYSGSNSTTTVSPNGAGSGRDTSLITNAFLPFTPQAGYIYDLEATVQVPQAGATSTTDTHWVGLSFLNGNGHSSTGQALSNDNPTGLVIVRDGVTSTTTGTFVDIFESATGGTGGDNSFAPGALGSAVTVDVILNEQAASPTISWLLNGVSVGSPVTLGTISPIEYVAFGNDTAPAGTITNFSLTTIPEPASMGLLGLGGLLALRRRHQRA